MFLKVAVGFATTETIALLAVAFASLLNGKATKETFLVGHGIVYGFILAIVTLTFGIHFLIS